MWIFGYGSLMWDGWEEEFGCLQRTRADLPGYRRLFNKASIRNWGTPEAPGPTLSLSAATGAICQGIAFNFPIAQASLVSDRLCAREGKGFSLVEVQIRTELGKDVRALVSLYSGKNLIKAEGDDELVAMVLRATGDSGSCLSYVRGVAEKLATLGVSDPEVERLSTRLRGLAD